MFIFKKGCSVAHEAQNNFPALKLGNLPQLLFQSTIIIIIDFKSFFPGVLYKPFHGSPISLLLCWNVLVEQFNH